MNDSGPIFIHILAYRATTRCRPHPPIPPRAQETPLSHMLFSAQRAAQFHCVWGFDVKYIKWTEQLHPRRRRISFFEILLPSSVSHSASLDLRIDIERIKESSKKAPMPTHDFLPFALGQGHVHGMKPSTDAQVRVARLGSQQKRPTRREQGK